MTPTNELRFVEREVNKLEMGMNGIERNYTITQRILQQKWEGEHHENIAARKYLEEWRDVPVVKE